MSRILPTSDEVPALVPRPGSPVWRYAGDARLFAASGYALVLQVAHPTVGAGVAEHSNFRADPYGRLLRTLDYVNGTVYGGPALAAEIGRRVRGMHRDIKGVHPDGERYHALEPEAYAWVHATLADAIVSGHRWFGRPLAPAEAEAFWAEWKRLGRLVGVRDRDLPDGWGAFRRYFDETVRDVLVDHPTVHVVIDTLSRPAAPPVPGLSPRAWRVARRPLAAQVRLSTVGLLPPLLRERCGLPWTPRDERTFRALAAASRASGPLMPRTLRELGPAYVKWRRTALARGDVAARAA